MFEVTPALIGFVIAGVLILLIVIGGLIDETIKLFREIFGKRRAK